MLSVVKASRLIAKFRRLASRQLSKTADEGLIIYNSAWVLSVKVTEYRPNPLVRLNAVETKLPHFYCGCRDS